MSTYRPSRRDPLTYRWARRVSDTLDDPYAYSEGPVEPQQRLIVEHDTASLGHSAVLWVSIIGLLAVVSALLI